MAYEDVFQDEIRVLEEVLALADRVSKRLGGLERRAEAVKKIKLEQQLVDKVEEFGEDSAEPW